LVPNTGAKISGKRVKTSIRTRIYSFFSPSAFALSDGAAGAAAAPAAAGAAATALGLPGLGNRNCLCSTPAFFNSDETVSDGTAPTSSQYLHRSTLATNCFPESLFRGS